MSFDIILNSRVSAYALRDRGYELAGGLDLCSPSDFIPGEYVRFAINMKSGKKRRNPRMIYGKFIGNEYNNGQFRFTYEAWKHAIADWAEENNVDTFNVPKLTGCYVFLLREDGIFLQGIYEEEGVVGDIIFDSESEVDYFICSLTEGARFTAI